MDKEAGEPLGVEVSSAVFDRIRTCDNHCAFCFIYQLPKGMRSSLYLKDDDYRLSFLYGNFTTLTRFTELDAERVLTERLGPLFVSIHATDPELRAHMLRNPKGATSLRWLEVLLEGGIEVHGQVVVCPGVNDGAVARGHAGRHLGPLPGTGHGGGRAPRAERYSHEPEMRPHTPDEAEAVCDAVAGWQGTSPRCPGRRLVYAADEYYLMAGRALPPAAHYEGFPQHENGIGMARAFETGLRGDPAASGPAVCATASSPPSTPPRRGVPRRAPVRWHAGSSRTGRARRAARLHPHRHVRRPRPRPARGRPSRGPTSRCCPVDNNFFGGTIGVAGLLTGADLGPAAGRRPDGGRYLLPDACL